MHKPDLSSKTNSKTKIFVWMFLNFNFRSLTINQNICSMLSKSSGNDYCSTWPSWYRHPLGRNRASLATFLPHKTRDNLHATIHHKDTITKLTIFKVSPPPFADLHRSRFGPSRAPSKSPLFSSFA